MHHSLLTRAWMCDVIWFRWSTTPAVINAFYSAGKNQISEWFTLYVLKRCFWRLEVFSVSGRNSSATFLQRHLPHVSQLASLLDLTRDHSNNSKCFSACRSMNYGGIAMVIGHEVTHGFDDRGRQFDKNGNLQQWWTHDIIDEFKHRAQCMIEQYSRYRVPEVNMTVH